MQDTPRLALCMTIILLAVRMRESASRELRRSFGGRIYFRGGCSLRCPARAHRGLFEVAALKDARRDNARAIRDMPSARGSGVKFNLLNSDF